ncbi:ABC transporter permease [Microbacterium soli]|uniref:ABC transporter permease n=1 Tax=Microbacterium soli TaxID=446075 RepID=A0ABP7MXB7_9MICO
MLLVLREGTPTPEEYARVRTALGLDGSLFEQFSQFLGQLASFEFGTSLISGRSVGQELLLRMPTTLQLTLIAMLCTVLFATIASYIVAVKRSSIAGKVLRAYARTAGAVPDFVLGVISIFLFFLVLGWAPAPIGLVSATQNLPPSFTGFALLDAILAGDLVIIGSILAHLALPVLVLTLGYAPLIMKILIISIESAVDAPATRFRVSTGSSRLMVMVSIFRRSAPPAVVVCGMLFASLLGGSMILDELFSLNGVGQFAIGAIDTNDFPVMQGFLVLTAGIALVVYLVVDLTNMILDPRRRPGASQEGTA